MLPRAVMARAFMRVASALPSRLDAIFSLRLIGAELRH